jgi:hypothetical protein
MEYLLFLQKSSKKTFDAGLFYTRLTALAQAKPMAQSCKSFLVLFFKKEPLG